MLRLPLTPALSAADVHQVAQVEAGVVYKGEPRTAAQRACCRTALLKLERVLSAKLCGAAPGITHGDTPHARIRGGGGALDERCLTSGASTWHLRGCPSHCCNSQWLPATPPPSGGSCLDMLPRLGMLFWCPQPVCTALFQHWPTHSPCAAWLQVGVLPESVEFFHGGRTIEDQHSAADLFMLEQVSAPHMPQPAHSLRAWEICLEHVLVVLHYRASCHSLGFL